MAATILVVGGGFAGRAAVRHFLDAKPPARVILVDDKSFFEFTPSVLRCMVQPNHIQNITFDHQTHSTLEFIEGRVIRLSEEEATVHTRDRGSTSTIPYNYCVWATGVQYAAPITIAHGDTSPTISIRQEEFHDYQSKVLHANHILIIGAGPIGVELAAELIHLGKREGRGTATITLASSSNGVLPRLPKRAGSFAEAWLRHRGVQILRARLEPLSTNSRDLVFDCTGAKDNGATNALVQGGLCQADYLGKAGSIETLETLQLPNASHIFVAGDVGRVPNELDMNGLACEKTAYAAEECGLLAARNVMTLLRSRNERTGEEQISLHQYPKDVLPRGKFPRLFVISLFKYHAILCLGPVVVAGRLPSLIKVAIEFFGVLSAKSNSFVAQIFRFLERITYVLAVAFALVCTWFRGQNLI